MEGIFISCQLWPREIERGRKKGELGERTPKLLISCAAEMMQTRRAPFLGLSLRQHDIIGSCPARLTFCPFSRLGCSSRSGH